jgi:hypothetical protein
MFEHLPLDLTLQEGPFTTENKIEVDSFLYYVDNTVCFTDADEFKDNIVNH